MNKLGKFVVAVALSAAAVVAFALPTSDDVQAAVKAGNYAQAETMLQEVVAAKPTSAKAHYLYAEILAHNARFDQASIEARTAKQLDPKIGFTDPAKFVAFEQLLEREQNAKAAARSNPARTTSMAPSARPAPAPAPVERSSGVPGWVWGLGFAVVAFVIYRMVTARNNATQAMGGYPANDGYPANGGYPAAPQGGPGYPAGYGGYPGAPQAAPGRSGLLGAGLAGAGGFAAGMLAEKLMSGGHQQDLGSAQVANNGGLVPGMFDNNSRDESAAAQALEDRSIDFGNGGNDWGGDAGGGDGGSSSSSDDGW